MSITATQEAEKLLKDSLAELESVKGSVLTGVQKLQRASKLLCEEDIVIWCEIQLGKQKYTVYLQQAADTLAKIYPAVDLKIKLLRKTSASNRKLTKSQGVSEWDEKAEKAIALLNRLKELGLKEEIHYPDEEQSVKSGKGGGGYMNIGVVENMLTDIIKNKKGNLGDKYFQINLSENLNYVRKSAHGKAETLYRKLLFSRTPQTSLDILRATVDDKLLDLAPSLAEKLMNAFRSVSSNNAEE